MKWILFCATTSCLFAKHTPPEAPCTDPDKCYVDLFKRDAQIFSVHADFLYWTVAEGALDYALRMRENAWGPSTSYAQGTFQSGSYDLDPGFRVALLYFRAPHFWEIQWQYTRVTLDGRNTANKPLSPDNYLTGTWPQITTAPLTSATSHIHMNYNVFDMGASRVFFPNPHLRLRLLGGALLSWIEQDWKVRYMDATPNSTTIRNQWDFIGGGLKSGLMADWFWCHDLYMTALGTFGLLIGSYSNHAMEQTTVQPLPSDNPAVPVSNTYFSDVRPAFVTQMLLGPSWQKNYPHNRIEIFVGFEMNSWFNLQEIYRSTGDIPSAAKQVWINSGVFSLYGLTTRLVVDF